MLIFVNLNIDPKDKESEEDTIIDQTQQLLIMNMIKQIIMSRVRKENPRNNNNFNSISSLRKQFSQTHLQSMIRH